MTTHASHALLLRLLLAMQVGLQREQWRHGWHCHEHLAGENHTQTDTHTATHLIGLLRIACMLGLNASRYTNTCMAHMVAPEHSQEVATAARLLTFSGGWMIKTCMQSACAPNGVPTQLAAPVRVPHMQAIHR